MFKYFMIFTVAVMFAGGCCSSIPAGKAPVGAIVDKPVIPKVYNRMAAENYMATGLSMIFLKEFTPGKTVFIKIDFSSINESMKTMPNATLKEMRDLFYVVYSDDAKYILRSIIKKTKHDDLFSWKLTFLKAKKVLWQDKVIVKNTSAPIEEKK